MIYLCDSCGNCKTAAFYPDYRLSDGSKVPLKRKFVTCHDGWTRRAIEIVNGVPERNCFDYVKEETWTA